MNSLKSSRLAPRSGRRVGVDPTRYPAILWRGKKQRKLVQSPVGVEKLRFTARFSLTALVWMFSFFFSSCHIHAVAICGDGLLRNRINRLMFCAAAARKNCSRTNFNLRRRQRRNPIWFEFLEQGFRLPSLPLCLGRLRRVCNLRARCRAGSSMWTARNRNAPLVHCAFSAHSPQRLRAPM